MDNETICAYIDADGDVVAIGTVAELARDYGTDDLGRIKRMIRRDAGIEGSLRRVDYAPGTAAYRAITA